MFGNLPSYAFFIRHVKGLTMQHVELSYELPDSRPAVYLQDVENGMISDFRAGPGTVSGCQLLIDSSRKLLIRNCYSAEKGNLASIKNGSTDLYFINNVLFNEHAKLISKDETIKESDVIIK